MPNPRFASGINPIKKKDVMFRATEVLLTIDSISGHSLSLPSK